MSDLTTWGTDNLGLSPGEITLDPDEREHLGHFDVGTNSASDQMRGDHQSHHEDLFDNADDGMGRSDSGKPTTGMRWKHQFRSTP